MNVSCNTFQTNNAWQKEISNGGDQIFLTMVGNINYIFQSP